MEQIIKSLPNMTGGELVKPNHNAIVNADHAILTKMSAPKYSSQKKWNKLKDYLSSKSARALNNSGLSHI